MSKSQTLGWATVAGITAVCCWLISGMSFIGTAAMFVCIGFMLLYGYKRLSHARLLREAKAEAEKETPVLAPVKTSSGSSRLFVPQPLNK
jgi:predicted DNA repair protein MutK